MIIFKNHQLKIYILNFWIIWFIYLISISQISSKHLQKTILSKNKSYITNNIISTLLNKKKSKRKTNSNYPNQNNNNYIIFFIIGLYLICEMKKFEQN